MANLIASLRQMFGAKEAAATPPEAAATPVVTVKRVKSAHAESAPSAGGVQPGFDQRLNRMNEVRPVNVSRAVLFRRQSSH